MLYLDIAKACHNKGIDDPKRWLISIGFSYVAATRLLDNAFASIRLDTLEKLCTALYCTPTEIMSWQPKDAATAPANHPLQKMKHLAKADTVTGKLKTLSPEKIEEVQKFLDGLKDE